MENLDVTTNSKNKILKRLPGPVVIGGVGGSGTRIVTEILMGLNFYMGSDLNRSRDNLWFTLLFKRPRWFLKNNVNGKGDISKAMDVFGKAMLGNAHFGLNDISFILRAALPMSFTGHDNSGSGKGFWPLERARRMIFSKKPDLSAFKGWGFKEPNTHIFLDHLNAHFKGLKYIHVIRHGLDMAFGKNQAQLYNWGGLFGVPAPRPASPDMPKASLKYWIAANRRAIVLGKRLLRDRFLLVNFDRLCEDPKPYIKMISDFAGVSADNPKIEELGALVKRPGSIGRHIGKDLSIISADDIEAVNRLVSL